MLPLPAAVAPTYLVARYAALPPEVADHLASFPALRAALRDNPSVPAELRERLTGDGPALPPGEVPTCAAVPDRAGPLTGQALLPASHPWQHHTVELGAWLAVHAGADPALWQAALKLVDQLDIPADTIASRLGLVYIPTVLPCPHVIPPLAPSTASPDPVLRDELAHLARLERASDTTPLAERYVYLRGLLLARTVADELAMLLATRSPALTVLAGEAGETLPSFRSDMDASARTWLCDLHRQLRTTIRRITDPASGWRPRTAEGLPKLIVGEHLDDPDGPEALGAAVELFAVTTEQALADLEDQLVELASTWRTARYAAALEDVHEHRTALYAALAALRRAAAQSRQGPTGPPTTR